jgi:hypothetical protein
VFERAIDGVVELAGCGNEDLQLGFATCLSLVIERSQVGSDPTQCGTRSQSESLEVIYVCSDYFLSTH